MDRSQFIGSFPGRLVPIRFGEHGEQKTFAFEPHPLPPRVDRDAFIGRLSDALIAAERSLSRLEVRVDSLPNPNVLLFAMRRREAIQSSLIEDTKATAEQLSFANAGLQLTAEVKEDVEEVRNNVRAIELGVEDRRPLCLDLIQDMHAALVRNVRGKDKEPGKFRSIQVQIGGDPKRPDLAKFLPQPPGPSLIESLRAYEKFMHPNVRGGAQRERFPDLVELAFNHYQFESIHPFQDGNGRIGRAIINILPCKAGWLKYPVLNVSTAIERRREAYYQLLLAVSTQNKWEEWTRFFLEVVSEQSSDDLERVNALHLVREEARRRVANEQSSGLTLRLVDVVFDAMALTPSIVEKRLAVTAPTSRKHILRLCDAKLLDEIKGGDWGRLYGSYVLFDIINAATGAAARRIADAFVAAIPTSNAPTSPSSPSPASSPRPSPPG